MLLNLLKDDKYLLLPSDFGALSFFVDALRLSEGIIDVFIDFTLAERASEALVGVVMALGKLVRGTAVLAGVIGTLSFSILVSREAGRVVDVSSSMRFLTRLPEAVFSRRPVSPIERRDLVNVDFESFDSTYGSSRPALELLRFNEVVFACSLFFHVEAWFAIESIFLNCCL